MQTHNDRNYFPNIGVTFTMVAILDDNDDNLEIHWAIF